MDRCFAEFEFSAAVQALYVFFWNDFCDWYVEVSKAKLQDPATKPTCLAIQDLVLRQTLLQLHPFIPFITEELWHQLGYGPAGTFLMRDARLENSAQLAGGGLSLDPAAAQQIEWMKAYVSQARALKAEHNVASRRDVVFATVANEAGSAILAQNREKLLRLLGAKENQLVTEPPKGAPAVVTPLGTLYLELTGLIDPAAEKIRLTKELEAMAKHVAATAARLANKAFTDKAPPAVLEGARKQLADQQAKQAELERLLGALG